MTEAAFDPTTTYAHLHGGRVERMPVDASFWDRLAAGERPLPGWLVAMYQWSPAADPGAGAHSEVHPRGDELHVCVSGAMTAVLEHDGREERVDFAAGQACVVPAGVWHHLVARAASQVLSLTFGEGTEHRRRS